MKALYLIAFAVMIVSSGMLSAADDWQNHFSIPTVKELPLDLQIVSEKKDKGIHLIEFYLKGAPFNGQPTKIYGWYARPLAEGKYPAIVDLHGAGLGVLGSGAAEFYASNGFCCTVIDWCGSRKGHGERKPPYSEFDSPGNEADQSAGAWHTFGSEKDGIRNGVLFVKRAVQFLQGRPEVDSNALFLVGCSAGAHLTLLALGAEPAFKAGAVKYGNAFIRDTGWFGGYFGPIACCPRPEQDEWLSVLDPKHGIPGYKAKVLLLSGTDDIFFWMPVVLHTYRNIPTEKRLIMLPNDNHSQTGNTEIPLAYFKSVLGTAPAWPLVGIPKAVVSGSSMELSVGITGPEKISKVSFYHKRMKQAQFWHGARPGVSAKWEEAPAALKDNLWTATIEVPGDYMQLVAYAHATTEKGIPVSSDSIEFPSYPKWRGNLPPPEGQVSGIPGPSADKSSGMKNFFSDPSFEGGKEANGVIFPAPSKEGEYDSGGTKAHSGKTAVSMGNVDSAGPYISCYVPAWAGKKFRLSIWARSENPDNLLLKVVWFSAKDAFIKVDQAGGALGESYKEIILEGVIPDDATYAYMAIGGNHIPVGHAIIADDIFYGMEK
ncbi:MAG: acetylxylan esterase [Victivallales bacterium]